MGAKWGRTDGTEDRRKSGARNTARLPWRKSAGAAGKSTTNMTKKSNTADWTVAKVKTFMGREGHGFNCELRYKGEPVCFIINSADGGDFRWQWNALSARAKSELKALVKALPKVTDKDFPEGLAQNEDMWLEGLVNDHTNAAQLKKWCSCWMGTPRAHTGNAHSRRPRNIAKRSPTSGPNTTTAR
jgi:hypothetical protein